MILMVAKDIVLRKAKESDVPSLVELITRLKRLNEEFDPLFKVSDNIKEEGLKYIKSAIDSDRCLVVVAERGSKVIGMVKVDIKERLFYEPHEEGHIVDLYVLPEFRRLDVGKKLIAHIINSLEGRVGIITVEFPTLNRISVGFYTEMGFRSVLSYYVKSSSEQSSDARTVKNAPN